MAPLTPLPGGSYSPRTPGFKYGGLHPNTRTGSPGAGFVVLQQDADSATLTELASVLVADQDTFSLVELVGVGVAAADTSTLGDATAPEQVAAADLATLVEAVALALATMDYATLAELAQVLGVVVPAAPDGAGWWAVYHAAQARARKALEPQVRLAADQAALLELAVVLQSPAAIALPVEEPPAARPVPVPMAPPPAPVPVRARRAAHGRQGAAARHVRRRVPRGVPARPPVVRPYVATLSEDEVVALYLARRISRPQAQALLRAGT